MRLSSSSHRKNEVIEGLEDNKLEGGMIEDFSLINSNGFYYPLPPVLLLVISQTCSLLMNRIESEKLSTREFNHVLKKKQHQNHHVFGILTT